MLEEVHSTARMDISPIMVITLLRLSLSLKILFHAGIAKWNLVAAEKQPSIYISLIVSSRYYLGISI